MHKFSSALVAALLLLATPVFAAAPGTVLLEGAIHAQGGGPAADGKYNLTFSIYDKAVGGTATWSEGPVTISTAGGRFSWALGSSKALDVAKLAAAPGHYLGIKVGSDPELPRRPMHSTAFALHAASAAGLTCTGCIGSAQIAAGSINATKLGFYYAASDKKGGPALKAKALDCTGCVGVAQLRFDKSVNLGGQALSKVGKLTVDGEILAQGAVSAQSFIGDGSKLTGIKTPSGDCPSGQVVWGIDAGGQLKCKQVGGALDAVSGGNMDNHFDDVITGAGAGTAIPDFNNSGVLAKLAMPDIGTALALEVYVEIDKKPIDDVNPKDGKPDNDISDLTVILLPPGTKALPNPRGNAVNNFSTKPTIDGVVYPHYVLHQNTGKGLAALIATYPTKTKPAQGNLGEWIGKNPKGTWRLFVLDNNDRKDTSGKDATTDGHLVGWHMKIRTISGKQVTVKGSQFVNGTLWGKYNGHDGKQLGGDVSFGAGIKIGNTGTKCDAAHLGLLRYDPKWGSEICRKNHNKNGKVTGHRWVAALHAPVMWSGGCSSHNRSSGWHIYCLNRTDYDYSQGYFTIASNRVNIKTSGFYRITFYTIQHGCGQQNIAIFVNGESKAYRHENAFSKPQGWRFRSLEYVAPFGEGDYIEGRAYHDGCGNQYAWHAWNSQGQNSRMTVEFTGPLPD